MDSIGNFDRAAFPASAPSTSGNGSQYEESRHESRGYSSSSYHHRPQEYFVRNEYRSRGQPGGHNSVAHSGHSGVASGRLCDSSQRKRRGNLPKETTDKLRAWFAEHLHHPYPSEDEKQNLMHQTGLQMNQISNWFINARRRHLPALLINAEAVSGAMSGIRGGNTGGNGSVLGNSSNGVNSIRSGGAGSNGSSGMRHKGLYPAADHMYASSDRAYDSLDGSFEPRATSIYHGDRRNISPGSDDDY
ncbi:homeodomain super [Sporothrix epigloea]|uniref:Homeodomain super n=1 Tax=Sporothrix epigloea TaxID=1892477 RepID=A0ABP0DNE1_9PEZI